MEYSWKLHTTKIQNNFSFTFSEFFRSLKFVPLTFISYLRFVVKFSIFVTGQQPPPHVVRMLELGQSSVGGGGGAPTIQAPPPSNGFPTSSAMNMNMKPDNNSPSSSSQSPVPPSKLITSAGIPFQPHNLASYHHSPLKSEGPGPGGKISYVKIVFF